jgi:RecA DNA recombination protein
MMSQKKRLLENKRLLSLRDASKVNEKKQAIRYFIVLSGKQSTIVSLHKGNAVMVLSQNLSSGRMTCLLSVLGQGTGQGEFCSLVDAADCFDPLSAEKAGVDLTRLFWVRCRQKDRLKPLEQAFKAADILVHNGGFGLVAVDLTGIEERYLRKVPMTTWFRFARVVEKIPTALVFLMSYPVAQSCAAMALHLEASVPVWTRATDIHSQAEISKDYIQPEASRADRDPYVAIKGEDFSDEILTSATSGQGHTALLSRLEFRLEIGRSRLRKHVQSARPQLCSKALWG